MKTIKVINTGITINVNNTDEAFIIFNRIYSWLDVEFCGTIYHYDDKRPVWYTRDYFKKFFEEN